MNKLKWRKDYGDGQETDDLVLWINGQPTNNFVSGYGYYTAYVDGVKLGQIFDSKFEAKQSILNEIIYAL